MIRKTDDGESLIVPIARREILAGEMKRRVSSSRRLRRTSKVKT